MADDLDVALQMPSTDAGAESVRPPSQRDPSPGGPVGDNPLVPPADSTTIPRDQRVISAETRAAIARIAALGKRADTNEIGDDLVPMEHEPAASPAKVAERQAAAAVAPAPAAVPPPAVPAAPPAPVAADPAPSAAQAAQAAAAEITARVEAERLRADVDQRVKALEARESALAAREKLIPDRTMFAERPGLALATIMRGVLGLGEKDDAELKEAISDLVTEASMEHLGVVLPDEVKTKLDARRALRSVKAYKHDFERQRVDLETQRAEQIKADREAAEQRDQTDRERKAIALVRDLVGGTKESHPFVHAAAELGIIEDPSAVVVELIRAQRTRGEPADWQAAVKLANDHFRPKVEAAVKKSAALTTLLGPAPAASAAAPAAAAVAAPASQQVGDQVRRPTTLTATTTAPTTPDAATDDGADTEDRYDRRRRSLRSLYAKHRERFAPAGS